MATVSSELHRTIPGTGLKPNHTFLSNQAKNPPNQYIFARPGDPQNMIVHPAPSQPTPNFSTPPPHIPTQQTFQKPNYPQQVLRYTTSNIPTFQGPKPNGQLVTYRLQAPDFQQQVPPMPQYKHFGQISSPQPNQQQQQQIFYPCVPQAEYIPVQGLQNYVPCPQGVLSPIQPCPPGVLNPQQVCPPVLLNPPSVVHPHAVAVPPAPITTPPKLHSQVIPSQSRPQHSIKGKNLSHPQQVGSHPSRLSHPKSVTNPPSHHHNVVSTKSCQNGATSPQVPQNLINTGVQAIYPQFQQPGVHTPRSPNQLPQVVYGIQTPTISNSQKVRYPYPPPSVSPRSPFPFHSSLSQASQVPVIGHPPPTGAPYHVNITYSQPQHESYPVNLVPYQNPPLVTTPTQSLLSQTSSPPCNKPNTEPQLPAKLHIQYKTNSNAKSSPCAYSAQVKTSESVPNNVINQTSGVNQPNLIGGINQPNQTSGFNQQNLNCANNQPCRYTQKPQPMCSGLSRPTELATCQTSKSNSRHSNTKPKHEFSPSQLEEIPDLRPQFLANQMLPQVGQVVLLPPLPPDRTIQTIQLLTPTTSGQFHMSTIVLPIIKLDNHQPPQYHPKVDNPPQYQPKVDTAPQYHPQTNHKPAGCHQLTVAPQVAHAPTAATSVSQPMTHSASRPVSIPSDQPGPQHAAKTAARSSVKHSVQHESPVSPQLSVVAPKPPALAQQASVDSEQPEDAAPVEEQLPILAPSDQIYFADDKVSEFPQQNPSNEESSAQPVSSIQTVFAIQPNLEAPSNEDLQPSDDELVKLNESSDPKPEETTVIDATGEGTTDKMDEVEDDMMLNQLVELTGVPAVVQGIDLDQVKQFAFDFKQARLDLGLTQSQVGADLQSSLSSVSQSTICRFERLEITTGQVKRLLPALQQWLANAQAGAGAALPSTSLPTVPTLAGDVIKKRKKRTVFSAEAVGVLCGEYAANSSPSSQDMARIAEALGHHKETVRVWFCNKRQKEAGLRKQQGDEDKAEDKPTSSLKA